MDKGKEKNGENRDLKVAMTVRAARRSERKESESSRCSSSLKTWAEISKFISAAAGSSA